MTLDAVGMFGSTDWKLKSHVELVNSETGVQASPCNSPSLEITSVISQGCCRERVHTKANA